MKIVSLALIAALGVASAAHAATVTLTFTGLKDNEPIENFYNGGTGGFGSAGGGNYGIAFSANSLAAISEEFGGSHHFSLEPPPATDTAAFFLNGVGDTMDVAAGFQTGFSFYYAAPYYMGSVDVYSGLDGTGTLLAADNLALTAAYCDPKEPYSCWVGSGVSFAGTAESVVFSGSADYIGFGDITLGTATPPVPTPEPSTLLFVGSSLVGLAGAVRRRSQG